jgi:hypothetical protein
MDFAGIRFMKGCAVILILLAFPCPAFSDGPCTCKDLDTFKSVLDQTARSITAWDKILKMMETTGWPGDTDQAIKEFKREVWPDNPDGVTQAGGLDSNGEPTLNPKVKARYCQTILDAIQVHEAAHHTYYTWTHLWESISTVTDLDRAMVLAGSEADAYTVEMGYLLDEYQKLKQDCEKPKPSTSPDEDQQKGKQAEQKHQVAKAATRVTAYANSLK